MGMHFFPGYSGLANSPDRGPFSSHRPYYWVRGGQASSEKAVFEWEIQYGIFHIAGREVCSRFEFAQKIIEVFELDGKLMEEVESSEFKQVAPRPNNSSFNLDKLSNTLDWLPGGLEESLTKMKTQLKWFYDDGENSHYNPYI